MNTAPSLLDPPVADWIDLGDMVRDPYPTFERLRRESPVAFVPALGSVLITTYDDAQHIVNHADEFCQQVDGNLMPTVMGGHVMLTVEDPEHAAIRGPVNPALRPKAMKEIWAPVFEANTRHYLDLLAEAGPDAADLNAQFAGPLAVKNLIDLLGIRGVQVARVREWVAIMIRALGDGRDDPATWEALDVVKQEFAAALDESMEWLRRHPDATFASTLMQAGIPDDVVRRNVMLALSGGMNEPQHAITSIVWALSEHPDQRERVLEDPTLWARAFEETLRWVSPVGFIGHQALRDTALSGYRIPAGTVTATMIASVNRDERRFPRADVFDIAREGGGSFAFGGGIHLCAGMWVARWSVAHIALPLLYARFTGLRNAPDRPSDWFGLFFRGLTTHPVTWDRDNGQPA